MFGRLTFQGRRDELQQALDRLEGVELHAMRDEQASDRTLLMTAIRGNQVQCARLLLAFGFDVNESGNNSKHGSCVHAAVAANRHEIVALLLQYKADLSLKNGKGQTALDLALSRGHSHRKTISVLCAGSAESYADVPKPLTDGAGKILTMSDAEAMSAIQEFCPPQCRELNRTSFARSASMITQRWRRQQIGMR